MTPTTEAAALELREELNEIAAIGDCSACECLLGVVTQAIADLRRLPGDEARDAEDDLRGLLAAGRDAQHSCLECDPCLPVEPYRRFRQALDAAPAGSIAPAAFPDAGSAGESAGDRAACDPAAGFAETPGGCGGCKGCC
jgi:hypothetical protein